MPPRQKYFIEPGNIGFINLCAENNFLYDWWPLLQNCDNVPMRSCVHEKLEIG